MRLATFASSSPWGGMSRQTTWAPSRASTSAIAAPMPREAPVTSARGRASGAVTARPYPCRSRCRVVLRFADGGEVDLSFLGPAGSARRAAGFGPAVQRWLAAGSPRSGAWLVPDADTADGLAVDVTAWVAKG